MKIIERIQHALKPKEVKAAEQIAKQWEAVNHERRLAAAFFKGEISPDEYDQKLTTTYPLTKIDLGK